LNRLSENADITDCLHAFVLQQYVLLTRAGFLFHILCIVVVDSAWHAGSMLLRTVDFAVLSCYNGIVMSMSCGA